MVSPHTALGAAHFRWRAIASERLDWRHCRFGVGRSWGRRKPATTHVRSFDARPDREALRLKQFATCLPPGEERDQLTRKSRQIAASLQLGHITGVTAATCSGSTRYIARRYRLRRLSRRARDGLFRVAGKLRVRRCKEILIVLST
jgi:hypothetical protein